MDWITSIFYYLREFFTVTVVEVTQYYFADRWVYLAVFVLAVLFLIIRRKKFERAYSLLIPFMLICMILFLYNPIARAILIKFPGVIGGQVFARFWLLFPVWIVVAYVIAEVCSSIRKKWLMALSIVVFTAVFVIFGDNILSLDMTNVPGSAYKINPVAVEVTDEILRLNNNEPASLYVIVPAYDSEERYIDGGTLVDGMLQYSGYMNVVDTIRYHDYDIDGDGWFYDQENYYQLVDYATNGINCDYVVCPDFDCMVNGMESIGYEPSGVVEGYCIYSLKH